MAEENVESAQSCNLCFESTATSEPVFTYLQVAMDNVSVVQVIQGLNEFADKDGSIALAVRTLADNAVKQFSSTHTVMVEKRNFSEEKKGC
jgi:hypothetical protein